MLDVGKSPKMSKAMIRSAALVALACLLWANAAQAQMSTADLVTRIDHLEAQIRDLTGTVEQLQYRNQQLEQELQRVQAAAPAAARSADRCDVGTPLILRPAWTRWPRDLINAVAARPEPRPTMLPSVMYVSAVPEMVMRVFF